MSEFKLFMNCLKLGIKPNTDLKIVWQWIKEGRIDFKTFQKYMQAS